MNYLGVDIYAHNRATRRFGTPSRADLIPLVPTPCPFCGAVLMTGMRLPSHIELGGFTQCPVGGMSLDIAAQRAATLGDDYLLPQESGLDD